MDGTITAEPVTESRTTVLKREMNILSVLSTPGTLDDSTITELFYKRDEKAIAHAEQKYKNLCMRIAVNILTNEEDSEECVNDTLLGVWNSIPPARPDNLRAYICKIARNTALKRLRFNNAEKRSLDKAVSLSEIEDIIPDERIRPDISNEEIGKLISAFLEKQKPQSRIVFVKKYWFFESIEDIAKQFSFSESKVKNILYRMRNKLRDYLEKEGVEI